MVKSSSSIKSQQTNQDDSVRENLLLGDSEAPNSSTRVVEVELRVNAKDFDNGKTVVELYNDEI